MKISIAMATYNGEKHLLEQLNSFVRQTRWPDQLVICDDCSSDDTLKIAREFSRTAPFQVSVFTNAENFGYPQNYSKALSLCTGNLVFLSDQDDVWHPEKIFKLADLADKNPNMLLFMNDATLTDYNLNEVGLTKLGQIHSAGLSNRFFVMGCCSAIRRELLDLCLPVPVGYNSHDKWIVQFADALHSRLICDHVLQYYRRHENNGSDFFVNRLKKATKWSHYKVLFAKNWPPPSEIEEISGLEQKRLLLEGVVHALARDHGAYASHLQVMESEIREHLRMMEVRLEIRRKCLPTRLVDTLAYWLGGGYGSARGFQSALRDMLDNGRS